MGSFSSLSYLLAISLQELFPQTEILQIQATDRSFFCDVVFPGKFTSSILSLLEERMRTWVSKKAPFQLLEMVPHNAAQFLEHQGEKRLAYRARQQEGLVSLLQLDRFFFLIDENPPSTTADMPFFKLVCFWPLKKGIRLIGVGASSKEVLKERFQALKTVENLQKKLEELNLVSWVRDQIVWESSAEDLKDRLKHKIIELYQGFDYVFIPKEENIQPILITWLTEREKNGFQFQKNKLSSSSQEPWDTPGALRDQSWGNLHHINSFLHIITKFLTIFSFDYEVVSIGKMSKSLEKAFRAHPLSWTSCRGSSSRLEFQVRDRLGQKWVMSSLEWDQKHELIQMTLCMSFDRWVALVVEKMNFETILDRLK